MKNYQDTKYCIKFDIPKNISVIAFITKMNAFLNEIQNFNRSIVDGIDETYMVESYIEDIEKGSIKWWLRDILYRLDDKAIDKFVDKPIKTAVASILKLTKIKAIESLGKGDSHAITQNVKNIIKNSKELENNKEKLLLEDKLNQDKMLTSLSKMSKISKELNGGVFIGGESEDYLQIKENFTYIENNNNEEILEENTIIDIYDLLTPTNKENCKWELGDGENKIKCHMNDISFFENYKKNTIRLGGHEKLKLRIKKVTIKKNCNFKKEYFIEEVIEIIK